MVNLTGFKKINIAIFISGTGSNLLNLIKHSKFKNSRFSIKVIFSDNKKAKGLKYAKKYRIPFKILNYENKKMAEKNSLNKLKEKKIKIICLAGYMKILSADFIKRFKGRILNIHPSLLPKYKRLNTHERVLRNKEKYSGCTVHLVNSKLDSGKIILQKRIKVYKNDNHKKLAKRILKQEHKIYPLALNKLISNS